MIADLAKSLVTKNVISKGTELKIRYTTRTIYGLTEIRDRVCVDKVCENSTNFECFSIERGTQMKVHATHIESIDGMEPNRIAKLFGVNPDGSLRPPVKKRGRKPKVRNENIG